MAKPNKDDKEQTVSGYFVPVMTPSGTGGPSLIDVRELFLRFRWLFLSAPIAGAIVMIAISFLVTPQYRVTTLLAPVENSPNSSSLASLGGALGGLGALAGINLGGDSSRNESIAVLTSKVLTTGYMEDKGLLPVLFAGDWDKQQGQWTVEAHDIPTLEDGYRVFDKDIRSVVSDRETGLVTLTVTWSDREQAAEWANQLVERANNVIRTRAIDEYERSIEYLNEELEKTTVVGVRQAIYSVIESQIEQVMLANVRTDYAFKVLDPAVTPEADDEVFPSRPLFAFAGLVLGFALAAAIALSRLR